MNLSKKSPLISQGGQILLIVILTMVVALTVGLSIASRIVTELKLSKQNEESQRAFQAAEAGVQQTLRREGAISSSVPIDLGNNSSFSTTFETDKGSAIVANNGQDVDQGVGADVWLSDYPDFSNSMGDAGALITATIFWGAANQAECDSGRGVNTKPALEIVILQGAVLDPEINKYVFEGAGCARIREGATAVANATPGVFTLKGVSFRNSVNITFVDGLIMKIIPIFNSTPVGIQIIPPTPPGTVFPGQGSIITSTGSSGDTVRKVEYYKAYPQMPLEVFPYSLLSQ